MTIKINKKHLENWLETIHSYKAFYIPYLLFVLFLSGLLLWKTKAESHLWISSLHNHYSDIFFRYFTEIGGTIPYIGVAIFVFYRYRIAFFVGLSLSVTGIISVILKNIFNAARPLKYFRENYPEIIIRKIEGVQMYSTHSFPSGHTITAFAFFLTLAYFSKKPLVHLLYFLFAALVGYSRIYLSQHFTIDVLIGSIVAVLITTALKKWAEKISKPWENRSLTDLFRQKKQ